MSSNVTLHAEIRADEAPWPSPAKAWWIMAVFFLAGMLSYTDRFILSLLVDPIKAELHVTDTQVSLLQGLAFALIYSFAGLPLGRFADILPRRAVIIAGVAVWSVATAACGLAQNFGQLFAARVAVGIGEAALAPAAVSIITDLFPVNRRGAAFGVFLMGMAIGSGASIMSGGLLLQSALGGAFHGLPIIGALAPWRQVLVLLCAPGGLVVAALFSFDEPKRRGALHAGPAPLKDVIGIFWKLSPVLLPLYVAVALASAGDFSLQTWLPSVLRRKFGVSPGEIGATLGLLSMVTGAAGSVLGGLISDGTVKYGVRNRILAALIVMVLGLGGALVAFAGDSAMALVLFTVWMSAAAISEAIGITLVQEIVPNEGRGVAAALVSFFNMIIGLGVGTTLTAVFTDSVYRDPRAVDLSITTVTLPAGLLAVVLYALARWQARKLPSES